MESINLPGDSHKRSRRRCCHPSIRREWWRRPARSLRRCRPFRRAIPRRPRPSARPTSLSWMSGVSARAPLAPPSMPERTSSERGAIVGVKSRMLFSRGLTWRGGASHFGRAGVVRWCHPRHPRLGSNARPDSRHARIRFARVESRSEHRRPRPESAPEVEESISDLKCLVSSSEPWRRCDGTPGRSWTRCERRDRASSRTSTPTMTACASP